MPERQSGVGVSSRTLYTYIPILKSILIVANFQHGREALKEPHASPVHAKHLTFSPKHDEIALHHV